MNNQEIAKKVIDALGGRENVNGIKGSQGKTGKDGKAPQKG